MNNKYQTIFQNVKNYIENDIMESEPKNINYIDSSALNLINTAQTISEEKQIPVENIDPGDISTYYVGILNSIEDSLVTATNKYIQLKNRTNNLSSKERDSLKKEVAIELSTCLLKIKDLLTSSGAIEHARIHHNLNMAKLNLPLLKVTPEQIKDEFDFKKNMHLSIPTLVTKAAFWINKSVKYIDNNRLSLILFESNNLVYTKDNYEKISDKEKMIAIYKEQILTRIKNNVSRDLSEDYSFTNLITLFSASQVYKKTKNFQSIESLIKKYASQYQVDSSFHDFYLEEIEKNYYTLQDLEDLKKEYDELFPLENDDSSFLLDMASTCCIYDLKENLYKSKSILMILLGYQLLEQKRLPAPYIKHFGKTYDPKHKTQLLCIDLPGYFMPACFHFDKKILSMNLFKDDITQLPNYKSFFNNSKNQSYYSTPLLFAPTAEQKKYIKDEFKKAKNQPDSQRTKILSQMNGMANGNWRDFETFINKHYNH